MRGRLVVILLISSLTATVGDAAAAVTIGQLPGVQNVSSFQCSITAGEGTAVVQNAVAAGSGYAAPVDGVITRFSAGPGSSGGGSSNGVQLLVTRGTGPDSRTVVAASGVESDPAATTFPTRLPIKAGDVIGVVSDVGRPCLWRDNGAPAGDDVRSTTTTVALPVPSGATLTFDNTPNTGRAYVTADIEPDADADGYGDETQDACPATSTAQSAPCTTDGAVTAGVAPATVAVGAAATFTLTVRNAGADPLSGRRLAVGLPDGVALLSGGAGCTDLICTVPSLAPGASAAFALTVRGTSAGAKSLSGTLTSDGSPDPDRGNDSAATTLTVTVPPPPVPTGPPGLKLSPRKRTLQTLLRARRLLVSTTCDAACTIRATAKLGGTQVGSATRTLGENKATLVPITFTTRGLRLIRARRSATLRITVRATSSNGKATTKTLAVTVRRV